MSRLRVISVFSVRFLEIVAKRDETPPRGEPERSLVFARLVSSKGVRTKTIDGSLQRGEGGMTSSCHLTVAEGPVCTLRMMVDQGQYEYLLELGRPLASDPRVHADPPAMRPRYHLAFPGEERTLCDNPRTAYVSIRREGLEEVDLCMRCESRS
jgi:hypothetical protein